VKIVGILVTVILLFSYIPKLPMDNCPEETHMGDMRVDCGNLFHCPMVINTPILESFPLPLIGQLDLMPSLLKMDILPHLIFHPPEKTDLA
jgi:hypothetical protein